MGRDLLISWLGFWPATTTYSTQLTKHKQMFPSKKKFYLPSKHLSSSMGLMILFFETFGSIYLSTML